MNSSNGPCVDEDLTTLTGLWRDSTQDIRDFLIPFFQRLRSGANDFTTRDLELWLDYCRKFAIRTIGMLLSYKEA